MMKRLFSIITVSLIVLSVSAQERTVENRPYTDLRPFHLGVMVGTHLQDMELYNSGPVTFIDEDGNETTTLVTADQDRWDPGFQVGVLGEVRLGTHFAFRIAPAMYFGARHVTFRNLLELSDDGSIIEQRQNMKSIYISCGMDLIFAAKRFNNHRPYLTVGFNPMLNLSGSDNDYLKLKKYDSYLTAGIGCDFYLPFFKLRPELKFMYSLTNALDTGHGNSLKDPAMLPYTLSVNKARTKIIALTLYFE